MYLCKGINDAPQDDKKVGYGNKMYIEEKENIFRKESPGND